MASTSCKASINPQILRWARESIHIDISKAAKTASVKNEIYAKWEQGEDFPSISKLRMLSNLFKRPLPVFFLPNVPQEMPLPEDFRKPVDNLKHPLSGKSLIALRKARWYQTVAGELITSMGKPLVAFQDYGLKLNPIDQCVREIRQVDFETQFAWGSNWEALKYWRNYLEGRGIFVFQFSMPKEEIRGFSLIRDQFPPVIVINSQDTPNGRIFTLFHEFCHILLREAGICVPEEIELENAAFHEGEKMCNEFAGAFLVPTDMLLNRIDEVRQLDIIKLTGILAKDFHVSRFVILRRLYSIGKINTKSYKRIFNELQKKITPVKPGGGDFYRNKFAEKGRKFISLVVEAESGSSITTSRALEYLDIKLKHYDQVVDLLYKESK